MVGVRGSSTGLGRGGGGDLTQHAKRRTGDCPGPRKETTTRRNDTQGGGEVRNLPQFYRNFSVMLLRSKLHPHVLRRVSSLHRDAPGPIPSSRRTSLFGGAAHDEGHGTGKGRLQHRSSHTPAAHPERSTPEENSFTPFTVTRHTVRCMCSHLPCRSFVWQDAFLFFVFPKCRPLLGTVIVARAKGQ